MCKLFMQKNLSKAVLTLVMLVVPFYCLAEDGTASVPNSEMPGVAAAASVPDVKALYKEGIVLFKDGKLNEAKGKFNEVLKIDPFFEPARSQLRLLLDDESRMLRRDKITNEKNKSLEVEKKWEHPEKKNTGGEQSVLAVRFKSEQQKIMESKAQQIIPEINFTDAHLRDVLQYLSRISGVNIILDEDIFVKKGSGELGITIAPESETPDNNSAENEEIVSVPIAIEPSVISDRVTISLKNIPLIEALKYIFSAKGLKYRVDEYAIVVSSPQRLNEVEMETRYYHLVSGIGNFTEFVEPSGEVEDVLASIGSEENTEKKETTLTIKDVLEQSGVPFPQGSKIFLDQRTGTLIIRNTPANLAIVENILRILDVSPYQIEIEARFVQITDDAAQELGFEWMIKGAGFVFGDNKSLRIDSKTTDPVFGRYPDPKDITGLEGFSRGERYLQNKDVLEDQELNNLIGFLDDTANNSAGDMLSISGVLTNPEFRMILHALNQSGNANLVSAPKVTTLNNQRAQIEMVKEFIYPKEYEVTPPTLKSFETTEESSTSTTYSVVTSSETKIITPGIAVPVSFETRDLGIILNVTPSVGADRKTITLTLIPEISEFIDWIDYGVEEGTGWNKVPIVKPIFETRNVTTSVVVNDGDTVVLGGLIKEDKTTTEDKIPLLGDLPLFGTLFRSKTDVAKKTNLVVFVTAKLVTPSGELVRVAKEYGY